MEPKKINCSNKLHEKIDSIIYCQKCDIYMCNKCKQLHSDLFQSHQTFQIDNFKDKDMISIFTCFCKDSNHNVEFEYFCKTHNILCCAKCISKIKTKENGKHGNCDICLINDIQKEKKEKLNENIKILEELSVNLKKTIEELKTLFNKINENKENLVINIQKIFTQFRNKINKKEDEIITKINNKYNKLYFKEDLIKLSENLPNKVNKLLEQSKCLNKEWKDDKLISSINNCIQLEKSIKNINVIKEKIRKFNTRNISIKFCRNVEVDLFENDIENFVKKNKNRYFFRNCPFNIEENKKYEIVGLGQNIVNKIGKNSWVGILCENKLSKRRINCWKIKRNNGINIIVGVATNEFDINSSSYYTNGWYLCLCCEKLFSGAPHNFKNKEMEISCILDDDIILIMDMKKKTLKILKDSNEKELYSEINTEKPLFPVVFLKNQYDSVEITDYYQEYKTF